MKAIYHIRGYAPVAGLGRSGFGILLFPSWREAVAEYSPALTQADINTAIEACGRSWLDGHGYGAMYDPDNCGWDADKGAPLGPNARKMYEPRTSIRVKWGEWGPEHITVPGNACGLDIDDSIGKPIGGRILQPHNVDSLRQASLLLTVFLFFADTLVGDQECKQFRK